MQYNFHILRETYCDLMVSRSQAKIVENYANYLKNLKLITSGYQC